jgi:rubrerythrin
MSIFNLALGRAAGDIILIGGDIVPNGTGHFYQNVVSMAGSETDKLTFMLCGNHDTEDYGEYFGEKNYCVNSDGLLIVVLDNSKRIFPEQALTVLEKALKENPGKPTVIAFHIPHPNSVIRNSVNREEWDKIIKIIAPCREQVKYLLCGHIHSYFEDTVDGMKLIASGGGGARIEDVPGIDPPYNHYVEFYLDGGQLKYERRDISLRDLPRPISDEVKTALDEAFTNECRAHLLYRLYAEEAAKQGKNGISGLFNAASDAEFYHARNHYYAMGAVKDTRGAVAESIEKENYEVVRFYKDCIETAGKNGDGLAEYSFRDASAAELVHKGLFENALKALDENSDLPEKQYYTCTSCGFTFAGKEAPKICPVCGAPFDKINSV